MPVGLPVAIVGLVTLILTVPWLQPGRKPRGQRATVRSLPHRGLREGGSAADPDDPVGHPLGLGAVGTSVVQAGVACSVFARPEPCWSASIARSIATGLAFHTLNLR